MVFMFWFFLGWFSCAELRLLPARDRTVPGKWRDSRLVGGDGGRGLCLCAMSEKPDDHGPLFLAKSAGGASSSRAGTLSGANDYLVPGGRGHGERRVGGKDDDDRTAINRFQFIRFRQIVGGKIDREAPGIRIAHCSAVARSLVPVANNGLVRVRPTPFPLVRAGQLGEHIGVDRIVFAGKITRLIVTPKLAIGERRNARDERLPIVTAPLLGNLAPVERQRTARAGITPLRLEGASVGTSGRCGSGNRDRSGLPVSAHHRKMKAR